MSIFEGEGDFAAENAHGPDCRATPWRVGDRVRVVDGPRMLIGATGTVVEVDVSGAWAIRVQIDRGGFDRALLAPDELKSADGAPS